MNSDPHTAAGLYVHVPFCEKFCLYCDFYSVIPQAGQLDLYIDVIGVESSKRAKEEFGQFTYDSVFLGGGTPSLLNEKQIKLLFQYLRNNFDISPLSEITIECNPSSVTQNLMACYRAVGINRLSLGIQSFNDAYLKNLGRLHDAHGAIESFRSIRASGFKNISIDLIYGLPNQTLREWEDDLAQAIALGPEHISAYNLIIEPETAFGELFTKGRLKLPSDETQEAMYELLDEHFSKAGYNRYEISNFAKPGYECLHNLKYWHQEPFLGLGPAAVSFDGKIRNRNLSVLQDYIDSLHQNVLPPSETETLDSEKLREEYIMMSLRLSEGLSLDELKARFDFDIFRERQDVIDSFIRNEYIIKNDNRLRLTPRALFISDEIIVKLI
jgi:oxygen-independent coproporphyrinogen-3 oxidase